MCPVLSADLAAAAALAALVAASPGAWSHDRTLSDPRITESSDLVVSALHPGLVWTTNDSGDTARVFGVDRSGRTVALLHLRGAVNRDWEALAAGRGAGGVPLLWVGDVGDNLSQWRSVRVYRVVEPTRLGDQDVAWTAYDLRYPDGPHDAETLLVDPRTQRMYIVTKQLRNAAVYEAPRRLRPDRVNLLRRVAPAPPIVTDGAFSPDGRTVALRGYFSAWTAPSIRGPWATMAIPLQPQGESLSWTPDGSALLLGSEGGRSQVWRVPVRVGSASGGAVASTSPASSAADGPTTSRRAVASSASTEGTAAAGSGGGTSREARLLLAAGAAVAALTATVSRRRRRGEGAVRARRPRGRRTP